MQAKHITLLCTVPDLETGKTIARELIDKKLAPCANIVPGIVSLYTWKGELNEDGELLLLIKTSAALFDQVRDAIRRIHPYEVPEIIALPIVAGHQPYLDWIDENTLEGH